MGRTVIDGKKTNKIDDHEKKDLSRYEQFRRPSFDLFEHRFTYLNPTSRFINLLDPGDIHISAKKLASCDSFC